MLNKLVREVKSLNPVFFGRYKNGSLQLCEVIMINYTFIISEASYRYYNTKCEEESAKQRGLEDTLKKSKRK